MLSVSVNATEIDFHGAIPKPDHTFQRFFWGVDWLLGRTRGGRNFPVFPDDTFLVSYPRSGNTWTRFLVANLISDEPVTFVNIESKIPDVYKNSRKELIRIQRPRILKSHEYFDPRYRRLVYIVRDPRDVVVSYYHYQIKIKHLVNNYPLERYVSRFVGGDVDLYGSWGDNVTSWLSTRHNDARFLLIQYEHMLLNPAVELAKIASHLEIPHTPAQLGRAVERSTAVHMRELEAAQADQWVTTKDTRRDKPFVRNAKSGEWQSVLSRRSVAEIESAWGSLMNSFGYELTANRGATVPVDFLPLHRMASSS